MTGDSQDAAISLEIQNGTDAAGVVEAAARKAGSAALTAPPCNRSRPESISTITQIRMRQRGPGGGQPRSRSAGQGNDHQGRIHGKAANHCYHWKRLIAGWHGRQDSRTVTGSANGNGRIKSRESDTGVSAMRDQSQAMRSRDKKAGRHSHPRHEGSLQLHRLFSSSAPAGRHGRRRPSPTRSAIRMKEQGDAAAARGGRSARRLGPDGLPGRGGPYLHSGSPRFLPARSPLEGSAARSRRRSA